MPGPTEAGRRSGANAATLSAIFPVLLVLLLFAPPASAVTVVDDIGKLVTLKQPARRIISLAPHTTELLFAAGAGDRVVGVVAYSDYPPAARSLPRVGGYTGPDLERIMALRPDLVVGWESGNGPRLLARLKALGLTVYITEPRELTQIATTLEHLGQLAGTQSVAERAATNFRQREEELTDRYSRRPPVTVFYEVWNQPLMTVGGEHLISRLIEMCGGRNIFAELHTLAPTISVEAVLAADPDVIIASGMGQARPEWLDEWKAWPQLKAVQEKQLEFIPPDLIQRATPRVLDGAERICRTLEKARSAGTP